MGLTTTKRKKVAGLPIGQEETKPDWAGISKVVFSVGSSLLAANRARKRLQGPAAKGKELRDQEGHQLFGKSREQAGGAEGGHDKKLKYYIEEHIDVAVPRREAYNQWTQFKQFSEILKAVLGVDQEGKEDKTRRRAKVGPSRRQWTAQITEQVPDERIAWKSIGGVQVSGVVTFHELDKNLTRVMVQMLYRPRGFIENVANWFRAARRRTRKDLTLFKNYMEVRGEASGAWRGEIEQQQGHGKEALKPPPHSGRPKAKSGGSARSSSRSSGNGRSNGKGRSRSTSRLDGSNGNGSSRSRSRSGSRSGSSK